MIGELLGPYRVTAKLGEGGMGVVYRAQDAKLGRDVAIKVLTAAFARDPERMARFEREARTLAALNHPNVATVYGVEQGALVMELVEGVTLAERLERGAIPIEEALQYARQIADGLEAAHEKGITHRDLKPANIKVTPEGQVKLLDFGLATAMQTTVAASGDPENSPTLTAMLSGVGVIMGTAGYMSPEQARGMAVDKRTDVWAFGVVLYEMLTGRRMFHGETVSDTLAGVLKTDPDWSVLPAETPPAIRRLLSRCLERDRKKRLRDIGDGFLEDFVMAPEKQRKGIPSWVLATGAALLAGTAVWFLRAPKPPAELPLRSFSFAPKDLANTDYANRAVISPNGKQIAYAAANKLWIRDLANEQPRALDGTEGAEGPFWSPDSLQVAFAAGQELKKTSVSGGMPFTLTKVGSGSYRGGAWRPDGAIIVFSVTPGGLFEVPAAGGNARNVVPSNGSAFYSLSFLPGPENGRRLVAGKGNKTRQVIEWVDLQTGKTETIREGTYPVYTPSGHILFQPDTPRAGLWALAVSHGAGKPVGEPVPILNEGTGISTSMDGTLIWCDSPLGGGARQLVWRDRSGKKLTVQGAASMDVRDIDLSRDATRVAYTAYEQGNTDIWVQDLTRPSKSRFTFSPELDAAPRWSPTGKDIAFGSQKNGVSDIYVQPADGSGEPRAIVAGPSNNYPSGWSADGRILLFRRLDPKTGMDLWFVRRQPDGSFGSPAPFLQSAFNEGYPAFSPDGRHVVYSSDETGRFEVYVRSFPDAGGKRQVSADGGSMPRWSRDGKEIFYVKDESLFSVPLVVAKGSFTAGAAVELFKNSGLLTTTGFTYDVAPDGQRFLIAEPVEDGKIKPPAIHVVQNWPALLRQKPAE